MSQTECHSCIKSCGVINRYRSRLSLRGLESPITIGEGSTPLIHAPRLATAIGFSGQLYLKYEGMNPTGSFKDRGMTTAVTDAVANGSKAIICASTGNTAASAAAYAARAGIRCYVVIPHGKVALGKLAGAVAYGATVLQIEGGFDQALDLVREVAGTEPVALVNSVNPARIQGQKTAAWEIQEALGKSPDLLCLPVGNAGNITSYWLGFNEAHTFSNGRLSLPTLLGVQAEGAAPFIAGHPIDNPETLCTAIRIGKPARWQEAETAISESNGQFIGASDAYILDTYRLIARSEGVFCEPSSAAGVAGLRLKLETIPEFGAGQTAVAILTGHGLKDPDNAIPSDLAIQTIPAEADALAGALQS